MTHTTKELVTDYMDEVGRLDAEARAKKRLRAVEGFPFWPHEVVRDLIFICFFSAAILFLSAFVPYYLETPANPAGQPGVILPDWYLLWSYGLLKIAADVTIMGKVLLTGKLSGVLLNGVIVGIMAAIPFLSKGKARRPVEEAFWAGVGVYGTVLGAMLSIYSVNQVFFEKFGFLAKDYFLQYADYFYVLQTDILSLMTLFLPVVAFFLTYYPLKWRQGFEHYENKLSRSYFKIR